MEVIEEQDLIDALVMWKEQRKAHSAARLGRGFVKPDVNKYRSKVRCHNCHKLGHFQKDCKEPRRPRATPTSKSSTADTEEQQKGTYFCGFGAMCACDGEHEAKSFDEILKGLTARRGSESVPPPPPPFQ